MITVIVIIMKTILIIIVVVVIIMCNIASMREGLQRSASDQEDAESARPKKKARRSAHGYKYGVVRYSIV